MDKTLINPSELGKQLAIPQVKVIEDGKEIVRPDVIQAITQLATLGQLTKIRKSLEKEEFEGKEDPRTLNATDEIQSIDLNLFTPWIGAYFVNDGPDPVRISINRPYAQFELGVDETITVDHAHADERIRVIHYICNPAETASVRVIGQF